MHIDGAAGGEGDRRRELALGDGATGNRRGRAATDALGRIGDVTAPLFAALMTFSICLAALLAGFRVSANTFTAVIAQLILPLVIVQWSFDHLPDLVQWSIDQAALLSGLAGVGEASSPADILLTGFDFWERMLTEAEASVTWTPTTLVERLGGLDFLRCVKC